MRNTGRIANSGKALARLAALLAVILFGWPSDLKLIARPQASLQAVTDQITYNTGDQVRLRIIFPSPQPEQTQVRYFFAVRYVGEGKPVADGLVLGSTEGSSQNYRLLWKVPLDAQAGRYEIDMQGQDPGSHQVIQDFPRICSFVVHRQVIQIVSAEVAQPYYTSGDTIGCSVKIENLSGRPLEGLRLEFSERYWPWIVQQTERVGTDIAKLQNEITLKPHQRTAINSSSCAVAKERRSACHQAICGGGLGPRPQKRLRHCFHSAGLRQSAGSGCAPALPFAIRLPQPGGSQHLKLSAFSSRSPLGRALFNLIPTTPCSRPGPKPQ